MKLTYQFRLCDKHSSELNRQARAVNVVWNFCNETQQKAVQHGRRWLNFCDLAKLTSGSSKLLGLHAHTINKVCWQYDLSRSAKRKPWLRWRGKKSLGWIPFNTGSVKFDGKGFRFLGRNYIPMHLRDIPIDAKLGAGNFSQDAKGRWYINIPIDIEEANFATLSRVGVDLGLKNLIALSDGTKVKAPQFYRKAEPAIKIAQRANKKRKESSLHRKVKNRRKDFLHKLSAQISEKYGLIVIGNVSPLKMAQTCMAKSTLDAGWSDLKGKLLYKAIMHGGSTLEVCERMSSQTCSSCGETDRKRPKGIAGLSIRRWSCCACGADHDRDINAAKNIVRLGLETLVVGARGRKPSGAANRQAILSSCKRGAA